MEGMRFVINRTGPIGSYFWLFNEWDGIGKHCIAEQEGKRKREAQQIYDFARIFYSVLDGFSFYQSLGKYTSYGFLSDIHFRNCL